jgi:putative FmdB family regulatory protein
MPDYEFVCQECGRTFKGLTSHIGDEMCPACGSIDIELVSAPPRESASADERPDASDNRPDPAAGA